MKYAPPIGSADPNAGYVDRSGNTPGSPVPAAAIEPTMREILNVITKAGLTPDSSDLTQLWQAITGRTRILATGNMTFYIRKDGNDSNNGFSNTPGGAFLTIAQFLKVIRGYDMRGNTCTVLLGPGTYNETFLCSSSTHFISGRLVISSSDTANRALIQSSTHGIFLQSMPSVGINNIRVKSTTDSGHYAIGAVLGTNLDLGANVFMEGSSVGVGLHSDGHSRIAMNAESSLTISGSYASILQANRHSQIEAISTASIYLNNPTASAAIAVATQTSQINIDQAVVITGEAKGTGYQYHAALNSLIYVSGIGPGRFRGPTMKAGIADAPSGGIYV